MLLFDGPRQYDDLAPAPWCQGEAMFRGTHVGHRTELRAKPSDFDPQSRAMRVIRLLRAEGTCDECVPVNVVWPGFTQCAHEGKQHGTPCEGDHGASLTYHMPARVHDERAGVQHRLDLVEPERSCIAVRDQPRRGRGQ